LYGHNVIRQAAVPLPDMRHIDNYRHHAGVWALEMLLTAIYQKLGRFDEAQTTMQASLKLRPGTTALNVAPPTKNNSPVFSPRR